MQDSDFDPEGSSDGEAKPAARRQQSAGVQGSTREEEDDAEVCSVSYTCKLAVNAVTLLMSSVKQAGLVPAC